MKRPGGTCTIDDRSFLVKGGCPHCGCKNWEIATDGWAYCNKCHFGQSQSFDVSERPDVYDICPDYPYGNSDGECRKEFLKNLI